MCCRVGMEKRSIALFVAVYFEVETHRGPRSFVAKAVRHSIDEIEAGWVILV